MTTIIVADGQPPRCPCGRRVAGWRPLLGFAGAIALTLRCPRCRAWLEVVVKSAGRRRILHTATG